jgi:hypothetical protein
MYKTMGKIFGSGRLLSGNVRHAEYHPELEFRQEVMIEPEEFFAYRIYMTKFDTVMIHIEVLEGGDIDCLVMNDYNFGQYSHGKDFIYLLTGSILDVRLINYMFVAPEEGMYYFVLDNTSYPEHGARPCRECPGGGKAKVLFDARAHKPVQPLSDHSMKME